MTEIGWHASLSRRDVVDLLTLAALALWSWGIVPETPAGSGAWLQPRLLSQWLTLVLLMGAVGQLATRALGAGHGLLLSGLVGGFVSSTATIHLMGQTAQQHPAQAPSAIAAALLSNVATMMQMAVIVYTLIPALLPAIQTSLLVAGLSTVGMAWWALPHRRSRSDNPVAVPRQPLLNWRAAWTVVLLLSVILTISVLLQRSWGSSGLRWSAALTGLADAHATAASVIQLLQDGQLALEGAAVPLLIGMSTNAFTKCLVAWQAGGRSFALHLIPGQLLVVAGLWFGHAYHGLKF